ncbi:MAG: hypothetical protein JOZ35_06745 [Hyphomicrobiales bacterium]|nr:hypothetical protein [Hyphomicrobiales bacterium]
MDKQAWSRQAIVVAAAVVLAAAMPLTMKAHSYPFGAGYQVTMGAGGGSAVDKADPTDDGAIIIECVGFDGRMMSYANEADTASTLHPVSMPQHRLGPSKCWSGEHKRSAAGGGGVGNLMTVF